MSFDRLPSRHADRNQFIGGSDARIVMGKDEKALHRLWREKRGEETPPDLSAVLIVQLGLATEDLNRRWYELNSGHRVSDIQRRAIHCTIPWMAATLDGRSRRPGPSSKPSSCCRDRSRKRLRPRSTWPSSSTTCWSPAPRNPFSPSSTAAANGLKSLLRPTRSPDNPDSC
jgi:YqaJ-like viral recombinase domain